MTDNKEVKMVNESMDSDNETHNKDNGKAGTTSGAIDTITLKDTFNSTFTFTFNSTT